MTMMTDLSSPPKPRVLVLHNRYRIEGGEERSVELHVRALEDANVPWRLIERRSSRSSRVHAGAAVLGGGSDVGSVAAAVEQFDANVVHAHNIQPLIGPRGLAAARNAGARVVLQVHNFRLFCAIGVASRQGSPCFRCHGRFTLPGLVLNCRGSIPEAVAYALGLAVHQPAIWKVVDRFVSPTEHGAEQLARLGVPRERLAVLPHYVPAEAFADESQADRGGYALVVARLAREKGVDTAIEAAAAAGVPVRVAGDGPLADDLRALAGRLGAPVQFLGRVERKEVAELLAGAAMVLLPSRWDEFAPYAALEAMAAGVPVVATALGGLPELVGPEHCVPPNAAESFAERMAALWKDPDLRRRTGEAMLSAARERHNEQRYRDGLLHLYAGLASGPKALA